MLNDRNPMNWVLGLDQEVNSIVVPSFREI